MSSKNDTAWDRTRDPATSNAREQDQPGFSNIPPELRLLCYEASFNTAHPKQQVPAFSVCRPSNIFWGLSKQIRHESSNALAPYECAHHKYEINVARWAFNVDKDIKENILGLGRPLSEKYIPRKSSKDVSDISKSTTGKSQTNAKTKTPVYHLAHHDFSLATEPRFHTAAVNDINGGLPITATVIFRHPPMADIEPVLMVSRNMNPLQTHQLSFWCSRMWELITQKGGDRRQMVIRFIVAFGKLVSEMAVGGNRALKRWELLAGIGNW